jgi:tRNA(Arg) A34 adenosine deaminase TadA
MLYCNDILAHMTAEGSMEHENYMRLAIKEAEASLREGNNGFGAVIVKEGEVIAYAHDREDTICDPTSHAEMNAIREACAKIGKKLAGCTLVCTHEPCPMCAFAIVWAGIEEVIYGYSIADALSQGRKRINLPCKEAFCLAGADIKVQGGLLGEECSVLYREDVRREIKNLRNADENSLSALNEDSVRRRTEWFRQNRACLDFGPDDLTYAGYRLLLQRFRITGKEAPIVKRTGREIVFHSMNFCPTLEACRILGLDTRYICKRLNESSTDMLVKQIDPRLKFSRNYDCLRPHYDYCEERISLEEDIT